jgi:hypothetical protein
LTRQYRGIESGLHYRRDVTLNEDGTRLTVGNAGQNMAILNNLVIGLCMKKEFANLAELVGCFVLAPKLLLASLFRLKVPSCEALN